MIRESIQSLELRDLSFVNKMGDNVLSNVSLQLPLNEIVWVRGMSGAGKSVLAKLIAGLMEPAGGDIYYNGKPLSEMTFEEFVPIRCNIGYSFDFGGLLSNRDILGNLLLANEYHDYDFGTPDQLISRISDYMQIFNLQAVAYQRPSSIVGGLRKAACVARAFIHEPEMLLLDDPTTGLRIETKNKLRELIQLKRAKNEIKHIFIFSDDYEFMHKLNPVVIEVENGQVRSPVRGVVA